MTNPDTAAETADDRDERSEDPPVVQVERPDARSAGEPSDSFGWHGWILLAVVAFSFVVAPVVILWRPPMLPRWVALVAFPMLPGMLLGATAVWAALRG